MFLLQPDVYLADLTILLFISSTLGFGILSFGWIVKHRKTPRIQRLLLGLFGSLCLLSTLLLLYGSFIEPQMLVVTSIDVDLDVSEPLTVVLISDVHVGPYKGRSYLERVVRKTNQQFPDLVLLLGDYVFTDNADVRTLEPLRDLRASLGVYAVLGNHDQGKHRTLFGDRLYSTHGRSSEITQFLEDIGVHVLRNSADILTLPAGSLAVAGIEDLWTGRSDLALALKEIPPATPTILLSHNPSVIEDTLSRRADLIVAGHTHGGQIRLPFIGPLIRLPISIDQSYDQGLFRISPHTQLAITRGAGESTARMRLFAWPEVMKLNVR